LHAQQGRFYAGYVEKTSRRREPPPQVGVEGGRPGRALHGTASKGSFAVHSLIYLVGLIVIVLVVLSLLGLA
jgi:hypothetical protein